MTNTLLHIDSSALGDLSTSRKLTASIVAAWQQDNPDVRVTYRDLAAAPPPHRLTGRVAMAMRSRNLAGLSDDERTQVALSDELVEEFLDADAVVLGAPMYNFSLPTPLKAWIDRIAQAGRTFKYTESGAVRLAGGKRVRDCFLARWEIRRYTAGASSRPSGGLSAWRVRLCRHH
jgi:FMN-dependent NADH-azoreductase